MRTKLFLLLAFVAFSATPLLAQKHVIKTELLGYARLKPSLWYEIAFHDKLSFNLGFDYKIHRQFPTFSYEYDQENYEVDIIKYGGFRITPEFRIYPGGKDENPKGFYLAPYGRLNFYKMSAEGAGFDDKNPPVYHENELVGKVRQFGGGFGLGYQWLTANNRLALDFNFFGIGAFATKVHLDFKGTNYTPQEFADIESDFRTEFENEDIPLLKLKDSGSGPDGAWAKIQTVLPGFRFGFKIGYAF